MNKKEKELIEVIKELIEEADWAFKGYSDGCGCCSNGIASDDEDWIALKKKLEELV